MYNQDEVLIYTFSMDTEYRVVNLMVGILWGVGCEVHLLVNEDQTWMIWAIPPPDIMEELNKEKT